MCEDPPPISKNTTVDQFIMNYTAYTFWTINALLFILSLLLISKTCRQRNRPSASFWTMIGLSMATIACNIVSCCYFLELVNQLVTRTSTYNATAFLASSFLFFSHTTFRVVYAHDRSLEFYLKCSQWMLVAIGCTLFLLANAVPAILCHHYNNNVHVAYLFTIPVITAAIVWPNLYNVRHIQRVQAAVDLKLSQRAMQLLRKLTLLVYALVAFWLVVTPLEIFFAYRELMSDELTTSPKGAFAFIVFQTIGVMIPLNYCRTLIADSRSATRVPGGSVDHMRAHLLSAPDGTVYAQTQGAGNPRMLTPIRPLSQYGGSVTRSVIGSYVDDEAELDGDLDVDPVPYGSSSPVTDYRLQFARSASRNSLSEVHWIS